MVVATFFLLSARTAHLERPYDVRRAGGRRALGVVGAFSAAARGFRSGGKPNRRRRGVPAVVYAGGRTRTECASADPRGRTSPASSSTVTTPSNSRAS